jgi:hypothetical protein
MYSSSVGVALGGGLSMNTISSLPGDKAESVSESVRRKAMSDVVSEDDFALFFLI